MARPYQHYRSCEEFVRREMEAFRFFSFVGTSNIPGTHFALGPLVVEEYVGDEEPMFDNDGPLRKVEWQQVHRTDIPKGWRRSRMPPNTRHIGWVDLALIEQPYETTWTPHAQRHRRKWLREREEWEMGPITVAEFVAGYRGADKEPILKAMFRDGLRKKFAAHGMRVHIIGARRKGSAGVHEAAFVSLDVPERRESLHFISYIHSSARSSSVGVGLMDEWFRRALLEQIEILNFGVFWMPGAPATWKGFSQFKSQFGVSYITHPVPLVRYAGTIGGTIHAILGRAQQV